MCPIMMRIVLSLFLSFFFFSIFAQNAFEITIDLEDYEQEQLYLAYYLGDKQYIQDTVQRSDKGTFTFTGEEPLAGGVYLVVMAPDNNFFQILVDDQNQHFSVSTTTGTDQLEKMKFKGSDDNTNFYKYLNFLGEQRKKGDAISAEMEAEEEESKKTAFEEQLKGLGSEVKEYQQKFVEDHLGTIPAAIIQANIPLDVPTFEGTKEESNTKRWRWMQKHYFDHLDLADPRMLRTPFLFQQVDHFIQKLQVQHPDTIAKAIDFVLEEMKPSEDNFKFYLIHFLNSYAASKFVGMDAVYVHLVDKYYATGMAPWTEEEQLTKIIDNANRLRPLLIGEIAPDVRMQRQDGTQISLHEVESPYTVVYFWRYDCGHCKKSTPHLKEFYDKFKDRGVKIFAGCAKLRDEVPECWDYIEENEIGEWIHVVDPFGRSRFMQQYDLKTTPQIYVLDENKKIISKRLGAEQLEDFFTRILEQDAKESEGSNK